MKKPRFAAPLLPLVLILFCSVLHQAGAPPAPATSAVQLVPFLTGLSSPIFLTSAKDGSNRIFVVEQGGVIKVLQPGSATPTVFLDITARVLSGGERGLLGLAFHPQCGAIGGSSSITLGRQTARPSSPNIMHSLPIQM